MFRTPRALLAALLATAALAACSDLPTAGGGSDSADLAALNRILGENVIKSATRKDEVSNRAPGGVAQAPKPHAVCYQQPEPYYPVYNVTAEGEALAALPPCEPTDPYVTPPLFSVAAAIDTVRSYGTKYVTLTGSGNYTYASYGDLNVSFRTVGGCYSAPAEYSSTYLFSYNAPFTLSSSRSANYNGTISTINWAVYSYGYAESPEGGYRNRIASRTICF